MKICIEDNCTAPSRVKGVCRRHYSLKRPPRGKYTRGNETACLRGHSREIYGGRQKNGHLYCRLCQKGYSWKRKYGLEFDTVMALLDTQQNRCAICSTEFTEDSWFRVDHDHSCCPGEKSCSKCVRGLLCHHCNSMLGMAKDSLETLLSAVKYLERSA